MKKRSKTVPGRISPGSVFRAAALSVLIALAAVFSFTGCSTETLEQLDSAAGQISSVLEEYPGESDNAEDSVAVTPEQTSGIPQTAEASAPESSVESTNGDESEGAAPAPAETPEQPDSAAGQISSVLEENPGESDNAEDGAAVTPEQPSGIPQTAEAGAPESHVESTIGDESEGAAPAPAETPESQPNAPPAIDENGSYTTKDDVALYIHTYGHLPQNFITKKQARELGWSGGSVEEYAPGKCIGGDHFGNYEGLLPEGKSYTECDINTLGKSGRGAERIIFSDDGMIYYTGDHYASFTLLYGE